MTDEYHEIVDKIRMAVAHPQLKHPRNPSPYFHRFKGKSEDLEEMQKQFVRAYNYLIEDPKWQAVEQALKLQPTACRRVGKAIGMGLDRLYNNPSQPLSKPGFKAHEDPKDPDEEFFKKIDAMRAYITLASFVRLVEVAQGTKKEQIPCFCRSSYGFGSEDLHFLEQKHLKPCRRDGKGDAELTIDPEVMLWLDWAFRDLPSQKLEKPGKPAIVFTVLPLTRGSLGEPHVREFFAMLEGDEYRQVVKYDWSVYKQAKEETHQEVSDASFFLGSALGSKSLFIRTDLLEA
ncbi:MAG: hypothetical protein Q9162_002487 [Coniocarpon cinnabarinum]